MIQCNYNVAVLFSDSIITFTHLPSTAATTQCGGDYGGPLLQVLTALMYSSVLVKLSVLVYSTVLVYCSVLYCTGVL